MSIYNTRIVAKNTLSFSCSKSMQFLRTPKDIWARLQQEHAFTIDVCASHQNHLLPRYYTIETDGLRQQWTGEIVYCHPLFDSKIGRWVKKAYESRCKSVLLLQAATHTRYFHQFIYHNPNTKVEFLEKPNRGFRFLKDDGSDDDLSRIGYIKPLMIVVIDNRNAPIAAKPFLLNHHGKQMWCVPGVGFRKRKPQDVRSLSQANVKS
jgi:hypothetical protein